MKDSGTVEYTTFPSQEEPHPKPQVLQIPYSYRGSAKGSVCAMEWSSDGYVLAVGWQHGWAVWSVAGRCLAWGFGLEDQVDEDRQGLLFSHWKYTKRPNKSDFKMLSCLVYAI